MKKFFTLLWLAAIAFTFKAGAQTTTCNAEFSFNLITGNTVKFTPVVNDSPLVYHNWNFGDGSASSQLVSPTHAYLANGSFSVVHTIVRYNTAGTAVCTQSITHVVVIAQAPPACSLVVDFNWTISQTNFLTYTFSNLSTPLATTDTISWTFGDGTTSSQLNPAHTYTSAGTYIVCLRISKATPAGAVPCVREICKTIVIPQPCNLVVDFSWATSATIPLTINFQNLSVPLSTTDSITWNFGDGTSSHDVNAVHTYTTAGSYNVCLIVKKNNSAAAPCIKYICKQVLVQLNCTLVADFNWTITQTNPLQIEFHNLSTPLSNTDSTIWSFGDGITSYDVNPVHAYANAGTYTVCLTVKKTSSATAAPCVRTICKTIVVTQPCNMVPDFSWTVTQTNPLTIEFHNLTTNMAITDSINWTFGDGSSSNQINPVHTYNVAGTYTVCLRIIRYNTTGTTPCIKEICKTVVITQPCNLVVDFNWTVTQNNPLQIEFHNLSTPLSNIDSTIWSFGDGTSSYNVNPVHTYSNAGTYTVCLVVKKYPFTAASSCVRYLCKTIVIQQPCNMVIDFNWTVTQTNPLSFEFHNLTANLVPTDSIRWTFGDGTSSNQINPAHTYNVAGTYTVCLRIVRYNTPGTVPCIKEVCRTIVVTEPCTLVVNFNSQPNPANSLQFTFTNLSTPLNASDSVRWTFGDGTSINGLQSDPNIANPTHTYTNAGTYTVCLTVKKNNTLTAAGCVRYKCETIVVTQPCNFTVNFSWRLDSANNRKVYFTNLTASPSANAIAVWNFGDGTSATSWNAVHEYAQPGTYIVCLRIYLGTNTTCVREKCDTVYIPLPVPPCTELSKFHFEKFTNDNQKYTFTPDYINTTFQYTWTFGDGTGSHDPVAIHRYAQPGTYTACLTAWRGPDCASTTCHDLNVQPQVNCDTAHVTYTYQRDAQILNKIQFYAISSVPLIDQTWTISKLNGTVISSSVILHQNNPIYLFQDTGYYRVCLKATTIGGCIKEYCNYIRIEQVSNACVLQAFPNPATSAVNVNVYLTQAELIHASIYNSLNVLVMDITQQGFTGNNLISFNINSLAAGQYTIRLVYGNHVCYANFQKL